jgi:two-component system CheB/CheR fusion protein
VPEAGRKTRRPDASNPRISAAPVKGAFPVVGVGASAGGLEAFSHVLGSLPDQVNMALVLVQHLDPYYKSMLVEILARKTKIPVVEAKHGTRVRPNRVYVIPPNKILTISQMTRKKEQSESSSLEPRKTASGDYE